MSDEYKNKFGLRRVVITGMGAVSPFGPGMEQLMQGLLEGCSGVTAIEAYRNIGCLRSLVGAKVKGVDPKQIPRKFRRSMSSMAVYATLSSQEAIDQSGLNQQMLQTGRFGVCIGSTVASTETTQAFFEDFLTDYSLERMKTTVFFRLMNHTVAANVAQALGVTGRILAPAAACSTGCQAVGYGYEMVAFGKQDIMLCGGADELHPLMIGTFDIMNAASIGYNDRPQQTPRPFDRDRDGVVCAEGSGVLLLESLESARRRGATILAEIIGFATAADTSHIANPDAAAIQHCMSLALADAGIEPESVDYVNAHATATEQGDVAECAAISALFGNRIPVSSLKGHLGHTMAASGSIELAASVEMLRRNVLIPTHNLENVDPACDSVRHVREVEKTSAQVVMKNNFALGGVNSSIILRRISNDK